MPKQKQAKDAEIKIGSRSGMCDKTRQMSEIKTTTEQEELTGHDLLSFQRLIRSYPLIHGCTSLLLSKSDSMAVFKLK